MHFSAGELDSIDFTGSDGNARTLTPRDGVYTTNDPEEARVLRGFGLTERTDAQVKAQKAARSTKTRAEAGKKGGLVLVEGTGTIDTRGPGAPADEPGVKEV
jgi:hypothetical protein